MKRLLATLGAVALGAATIPGAGLGASLPRAELRAFSCQTAIDPINRSIAVTAVMRPRPGTEHMAIRFDLLVSRGDRTPARPLHAGDLGTWVTPADPTLGRLPADVWNLQKPVADLYAPAVYRFRVRYRWEGAGHTLLDTATRSSPRCRQPELRPDLQLRSISVRAVPGRPDLDLYAARIVNAGNSAAGPFEVLFAPADGSARTVQSVSLLRAHSWLTESFTGPACGAGTAPTITVDSTRQVDDLNRSNNALTARCPS